MEKKNPIKINQMEKFSIYQVKNKIDKEKTAKVQSKYIGNPNIFKSFEIIYHNHTVLK